MDAIELIETLANNACPLSFIIMTVGIAVACIIFSTRPIHIITSEEEEDETND